MNKGSAGCAGAINVVDGSVKGGIGVPLPSIGIHCSGQFRSCEGGGALENHVFEKVRNPTSNKLIFVLAAGCDPALSGHYRSIGIHLHDHRKPV